MVLGFYKAGGYELKQCGQIEEQHLSITGHSRWACTCCTLREKEGEAKEWKRHYETEKETKERKYMCQ